MRHARHRFTLLLTSVIVTTGLWVAWAAVGLPPENLGVAVRPTSPGDLTMQFDPFFAFTVSEPDQRVDANGDGDENDFVIHVRRAADGAVTSLGLAVHSTDPVPVTSPLLPQPVLLSTTEDLLVFPVREEAQGKTDLNGDGDAEDFVYHAYRLSTGQTTNLRLAATPLFRVRGDQAVLPVWELEQAEDLNGDGDQDDLVAYFYDAAAASLENLRLAMGGVRDLGVVKTFEAAPISLGDGWLAVAVTEADQAGSDLNDDGDATDRVLHLVDTKTGAVQNRKLAVGSSSIHVNLDRVVFGVSEGDQAKADLNGDGDRSDVVLHWLDPGIAGATNVGLAVTRFLTSGETDVFFPVRESTQGGLDLNGDGDSADDVLHVLRRADSTAATNLRLALPPTGTVVAQYHGRGGFVVWELAQGGADLNGDGDSVDFVAHLYDAASGALQNLGKALGYASSPSDTQARLAQFDAGSGVLSMAVTEAGEGGRDLNGDGDALDAVMHVVDLDSGVVTSTGLAVSESGTAVGKRVDFGVSEVDQAGTDLNQDGDVADTVAHVYENGTATNTHLAEDTANLSETVYAVIVSEAAQGAADLNGDGDAADHVLFVSDLGPSGTTTTTTPGSVTTTTSFSGGSTTTTLPSRSCEATEGIAGALCLCEAGLVPATCAGQTLPKAITAGAPATCASIDGAASAASQKATRQLLKAAKTRLKKMLKSARKLAKGKKVSDACASELRARLTASADDVRVLLSQP